MTYNPATCDGLTVRPDVDYLCDINYDPFALMREGNKTYGVYIAIQTMPEELISPRIHTFAVRTQKYDTHTVERC